ncbi:cobalamin-dependent protein [Amycolatopsis jiangsuensis]|uniref:Methylaspartate mutase sigma subunit n=1 Tax=Amycolatopsis jiangsuensis TaxID=1181879 RepID=A0A840J0Z8_9PSEU|nr:cobalamin-dependent protein [Amycolatopsis jiangsuensis]MBB4688771.1 methylaspartate mutase sigma subunit [Amycolatopsis jiangsuensis]
MTGTTGSGRGVLVLGVTASDAHSVANQLIAHRLRAEGYTVHNLGACTSIEEFARAVREHPETLAVVVGSLNGHAYDDLRPLPAARAAGELACPVVLGGNLSVGSHKDGGTEDRLRALGVDHVLTGLGDLVPLLHELERRAAAARAPRAG